MTHGLSASEKHGEQFDQGCILGLFANDSAQLNIVLMLAMTLDGPDKMDAGKEGGL